MLPSIKNDLMYLLNIVESIEKILLYSKDCPDAESFYEVNDQLNFNAALNLLANIGENTGKISSNLKDKYPEIQWSQIKGLRNKVVHDYVNIDTFMVYDIIKNDLNPLREKIAKIISERISEGDFDKEELKVAVQSFYYRHVNFDKIN